MTTIKLSNPLLNSSEISRLLTAAVINSKFCRLLLTDPAKALTVGFNGEIFNLTRGEKERLLSIHAHSLADLAEQLLDNRPVIVHRLAFSKEGLKPAYVPAGLD